MRALPLCAAVAALVAGCGDGEVGAPADAAPPAEVATPPATPPATPAAAGTATVSLRGAGLAVGGTFPARHCGGPATLPPAPPTGTMYEVAAGGVTLHVSDTEGAARGERPFAASGWNLVLNADGGASYLPLDGAPGRLSVSADGRTAALAGRMKAVGDTATVAVDVTFRCG